MPRSRQQRCAAVAVNARERSPWFLALAGTATNDWSYAGPLLDAAIALFQLAPENRSVKAVLPILGFLIVALTSDDAEGLEHFDRSTQSLRDGCRARSFEARRRRDWGPNVIDLAEHCTTKETK